MPFTKRSNKLPAEIRRLTVYSFVFFCLLTACKKHMSVPSQASLQIRIDSLRVLGFNHIKVSASYSSADLSRDLRLGVCWGTSPDPVASRDSIIQPQLDYNYLDTLISSLDSNTLYHLRAFCVEGRDTIYGTDTTIKTGALELTFLQQYGDTYNLELRQVVSLGTGYGRWTMMSVRVNIHPCCCPYPTAIFSRRTRWVMGLKCPSFARPIWMGTCFGKRIFPPGPGRCSDRQSFSTSVTADGYLALLGTTSGGNYNGMILQYLDDNNSPEWTYYRGRTILDPVAYAQDSKENFTVLTWLDGQNNDSSWLFNINASGSVLWQTTYPYSPLCGLQTGNMPKALALSSITNDYYVTGQDFILKTDPVGKYIWDIRVVPLESGIPGAIFVSPGNTITIIGTTATGPIAGLFFSRLQEY